jgi:predicted DNA binding CopG/RHH family protein
MSAPAVPQPSGNRASFASLLSSLTGPKKSAADQWDLTDLADDVATISYEQALRSHRRVPVAEPFADLPTHEDSHAPSVAPASESTSAATPIPAAKSRKSASITIRISSSEQAQLQERAAAAQLSVSAYLRSCIFEVESLRTQVKEALSQISAATDSGAHVAPAAESSPASRKRFQFFPRWKHMTDK